jgi:hypothetical protein
MGTATAQLQHAAERLGLPIGQRRGGIVMGIGTTCTRDGSEEHRETNPGRLTSRPSPSLPRLPLGSGVESCLSKGQPGAGLPLID